MPFQKGHTINAGGLTTRQMGIKRRLEGLTVKAVNALEKTLDDEDATHSERLAAAKEVLDRALGRPKQQANVTVEHNTSPHLSALIELAASTALRVNEPITIDVQPVESKQLSDLGSDEA
jgi:hypothetical protein